MARTIDDRVVSASFETSKFEAGTQKMLSSLDKLKKSMNFENAGKGLDQLNTSVNRMNLSHIGKSVDEIKNKFSAFNAAATATIFNLTNRIINAGAQFVKQFTFAPVLDGLHEYENQLNSVQTILANTKSAGTNLTDVNGALNQLNKYADKTIYNFGQMTKNIGTFTAAGVDLNTSVKSIKGISNLAALSGSSAEQASTAMYQLSQAISSGRVSLQDWNSVVNAGMGGAVFQRALAQTAQAMGKLKDGTVQLKGPMKNVSIAGKSFRESIQAKPGQTSWLTSDVLTNTLKQFSGDLSKAQLKAQGFSDAQVKAIRAQAKMALDAATQVKTFSQLVDTTKEAIGSGWASTFQIIFGDFGEAKKLWTGLAGVIGGFVSRQAKARNNMLKDWKAAGGRTKLIESFKQTFEDLSKLLGPIGKAFRDVFPKRTGGQLADLTRRLLRFTQALEPSKETVKNLRSTFRGLFAVLDIGKMVVVGIFNVITKLFGVLAPGAGGILKLTGSWGDWVYALDQSLKKTGAISKFFNSLGTMLQKPIIFLEKLASSFGDVFTSSSAMATQLSPLQRVITGLQSTWDKFIQSLHGSDGIISSITDAVSQAFGNMGQAMADAASNMNLDAFFHILEVGILAGIAVIVRKAFRGDLANALSGGLLKSVVQAFKGFTGVQKSISGTFGALTGSIKTMQNNVKSDTLKNIAISIALLAASLVGLSLVDPVRLQGAMSAMTIAFGELLGAMTIMDKIGKSAGFLKMPFIAATMVILATAIDLLSLAVIGLSRLSWEELAKGLGAVSVLLIGISTAAGPLSKNSAGMISAGAGITIIAVAMNILARAVRSFGSMDMPTLAKGIGGIAVALAGIGAASRLFPSGMVAIGVGLIAVGTGLKLIAGSVERLGNLDMSILGKGIGAIAVALGAIGLAMRLMPGPSMILTASGLLLVSLALKGIAKSVKSFGGMSIEQIAKGLGTLAGSLGILALGLTAMSGTFAGSASLAVAAAGIAILVPALKSLGDQSWGKIIKGMVALAAAFGLLGIAGVVLAPVAPAILALGGALIAVGAGLALAGAGVALIGIGLSSIVIAGPAAVKIFIDALVQLVEALPKVIQGLVKALVEIVSSVADQAPKFVKALGKILSALSQAIIVAAPQLGKAFVALLEVVFSVLRKETPNLVKTGFEMLKALLKGISNNISNVVKMVATIIGKFLGAIATNLGKIITGGAQILAAILKGIAQGIGKVIKAATDIIVNFLRGISNNIRKVADAGVKVITSWLKAIADGGPKILRAGTNIIVKFVKGIGDAGSRVVTVALKTVTKFITTVAAQIPKEVNRVATAIIKMLNALANVIRKREPEFIMALGNIGKAIVEGIIAGLDGLGGKILKKIKDEITSLPGKGASLVKKALGKIAASLPLPDGLGRKFGFTFTNAIIGELSNFEPEFQKALAKFGGATNIEFLYNLGNDLASTFKDGLLAGIDRGAIDPITQAGSDIVKQIAGNQSDIENTILESNNKIRDANRALDKDNDALQKARKIKDKSDRKDKIDSIEKDIKDQKAVRAEALKTLKANEQLLDILAKTSSFILLDPSYQEQINKLAAAKVKVKDLNDELEKQTGILEDLKSKRQSLFDQTFDKFSTLPGLVTEDANGNPIDAATQVQNYITSISGADDVVGVFANSLDTLQGMGLNADTYQQLLDVGPAAQGFVDALVAAGPGAVQAINAADTDLRNVSNTLADHAAGYLYDAGIKTTQGLVDGLKVKIPEAVQTAEDIATAIVKAIKKRLRIKSPSQVFAEIGSYSVEGMATGFANSSKLVTDAVYGVSDDAIAAIKKSMRDISDVVTDSIDPNPTITPILDLSQIQAGVDKMGSILTVPATASLALASGISVSTNGGDTSEIGQAAPIQFTQINNSPKSLSSIEIYRQTKNQLAQARPVLAK